MRRRYTNLVVFLSLFLLISTSAVWAQVETVGRLVGVVTDQTGAVIPGAQVKVIHVATGATFNTETQADGGFVVATLRPGVYRVEVTMSGFRQAIVSNVEIETGKAANFKVSLEVGEMTETIEVISGTEVLETTETAITSVMKGDQITQLPLTSRDALDLALMMPGTATPSRPRSSTVMGLPKGSLNITIDGINIQSNFLKSSDGFFALIRPRLDTISKFSMSTSTPGAESAGEGAVQIRFTTVSGANDWHGGIWWYHRNPQLNATPYFDNLAGLPGARQILNKWGGKTGGPILKDKLFFFVDYDEWRLPQTVTRARSMFTPNAFNGIFEYSRRDTGATQQVDLLALATVNGVTDTRDPFLVGVFDLLNQARSSCAPSCVETINPFLDRIRFQNKAMGTRRFPLLRLDYNLNDSNQIEFSYHFNWFASDPDTLNSRDPAFPGFPLKGGQFSNRRMLVGAWRSTITPSITNEFRVGVQTASVAFFPDLDFSLYPTVPGLGVVRPDFTVMSDPFHSPTKIFRNFPTTQIYDNVVWAKGSHTFKFGWAFTNVTGRYRTTNRAGSSVLDIDFDTELTDPAIAIFSSANFPSISSSNLRSARRLYAILTGRIEDIRGAIYVNPDTRQFEPGQLFKANWRTREMGFYGTDSWRVRHDLTFNYGLRWELAFGPIDQFNIFGVGNEENAYGISGVGNLFSPGTLTGSPVVWNSSDGRRLWDSDVVNLAPSLGIAWTLPDWGGLFGDQKTVLRTGYAISFTREGVNNSFDLYGRNPGFFASQALIFDNDFPAGSLLLRDNFTNVAIPSTPSSFGFPFAHNQFAFNSTFQVNAANSNLKTPYVQSWNFGIQREIGQNTVVEVRYVGNHAVGLWRQVNLNEPNIFENGFLDEFLAAQNNLAICRADVAGCLAAAGQSSTSSRRYFSDLGLPGQVAVPIMTAAFTTSGSQTDSDFRRGTFLTLLDTGQAGSFATSLAFNRTFFCRMSGGGTALFGTLCAARNVFANAGFPINFFIVNPEVIASASGLDYTFNGAGSSYHGLLVEVRKRMSNGLMFNFNYTFSKNLSDFYGSSSSSFNNTRSLRFTRSQSRGPSPFDLRHVYKAHWLWELPFGSGRRWSSDSSAINNIIGGWSFNGIVRIQSGRVALLSGGQDTFNRSDGGIELVGITRQEIENSVTVRRTPTGEVYYLPENLIDPATGRANPQFFRPCSTPGAFCERIFIHGPWFQKPDLSIAKKTNITEEVNFEIRFDFLNAFNHPIFQLGSTSSPVGSASGVLSNQFGRLTNTWQDTSTTNDLGSRMIQVVMRINF